jgi:predicted transcriptional regulator
MAEPGEFRGKEIFETVSMELTKGEIHRLDKLAACYGCDRDAIVARALDDFLHRHDGAEWLRRRKERG